MSDEIVKKLIEYIENTKDFILNETPEIFQQMIKYEKLSSILLLIFLSVFTLIGLSIIIHGLFISNKEIMCENPFAYIAMWVTPFLIFGLIVCIDNLIELKVAPKYYLLKKIIKINK